MSDSPIFRGARPSGRAADALRPLSFIRQFTRHAEGSVLVTMGDTRVLCTASVLDKLPPHKKGSGEGWLTAEYGMLPRSTHTRSDREAARGKQSGRTQEIQRLIGRSLRAVVDLKKLGERTLHIDCDVLQADGGTRCASICGAYVAVADSVSGLLREGKLAESPLADSIAAVSVGVYQGQPVLDLDYIEDSDCDTDMNVVMTGSGGIVEVQGTAEGAPFSRATRQPVLDLDYIEDSDCDTDMNVVMTGSGGIVEVQGTAEGAPFSRATLEALLDLASTGIARITAAQHEALAS